MTVFAPKLSVLKPLTLQLCLTPSHLVLKQIFSVTSDPNGGLSTIECEDMMTGKRRRSAFRAEPCGKGLNSSANLGMPLRDV